ncbi:metal-dependent transcriptional regulator [Zhihengliuella halotolerans]|uniref:Manganese transport regulator n=1 Tax=Zhihengliuella halotolerans TaxID=370736 RepID=A0A4Q8ABY9_9MICC|nr:metal-dependent transcriptional regulator [Zhihengliuella halotolerans]RZU61707.1 DtxR family iron (metal) dependent repressor [Zhihengliuella halotolerans]
MAPGTHAPEAEFSPSEENYLKVVYGLREWDQQKITTGRLAAKLGVSPASATTMVAKLVSRGLLNHPPYGSVSLTDAGREVALKIVRRHRLIETFLVDQLGYAWDEIHDEAEVLEHTVSERFINRIDALLGHPVNDPHGDPIPTADGESRIPDATRLDRAPEAAAVVVRISDVDPSLLRTCAAKGIVPGATLDTRRHGLTDDDAAAIWVAPTAVRADG